MLLLSLLSFLLRIFFMGGFLWTLLESAARSDRNPPSKQKKSLKPPRVFIPQLPAEEGQAESTPPPALTLSRQVTDPVHVARGRGKLSTTSTSGAECGLRLPQLVNVDFECHSAGVPDSEQDRKQDRKREHVLKEILSSEEVYIGGLHTLLGSFASPLREDGVISQEEYQTIFSNLESLTQFHDMFLGDLYRASNTPLVFKKLCDFLRMYTSYINSYSNCISCVSRLQKNKRFRQFLEEKRDKESLDLMSHLILPVQRIPRYLLLLGELQKYTPKDHEERQTLDEALEKLRNIADHVNEARRDAENMSILLSIQQKISDLSMDFELISPSRRLLREGVLEKKSRRRFGKDTSPHNLYVFTDALIWTNVSHRFKGAMLLEHASLIEYQHTEKNQVGFSLSHPSFKPSRSPSSSSPSPLSSAVPFSPSSSSNACDTLVFVCPSESERREWMNLLQGRIDEARSQREDVANRRKGVAEVEDSDSLLSLSLVPT